MRILNEKPEIGALILAALIVAVGLATWTLSESLANTLLASVSAAATAAAAVMIKEIDIGLRQLRFEALSRAYEALDRDDFKKEVQDLCNMGKTTLLILQSCLQAKRSAGNEQQREDPLSEAVRLIRRPSIELNKAGYLIYKGFLDHNYLAEEFGGFVIRAFACMRPLLICVRNTSEDQNEPWFMRRFALLAVAASECFIKNKMYWKGYFKKILLGRMTTSNALSLLAAQIEAYRICISQARDERDARNKCIDYLPAVHIEKKHKKRENMECKEIYDKIINSVDGDANELAKDLVNKCGVENISLIWRDWLSPELQKLLRKHCEPYMLPEKKNIPI